MTTSHNYYINSKTEIRPSKIRGKGLFAKEKIDSQSNNTVKFPPIFASLEQIEN